MKLRAIHRKVLRDAWHLGSQMLAVAVVMACGIAMFVSLRSMHGWLRDTQVEYYTRYRFGDVFAHARRAPLGVAEAAARIPGVSAVRARIVLEVTLDVPGLAEPATGRVVGVPEDRRPILNDVHLRQGRWIAAPDEVILSEAFAGANGLAPGDTMGAVINGRWQQLRIVGLGLSPEYVYEIRGLGDVFPDNRRFGVLWMGDRALAGAFDMEGAFNDLALALGPGASEGDVVAAVDGLLARFGGTGAYGRDDQVSHNFLSSEIQETEITSLFLPAIFLGVTAFLLHIVLGRLVGTQREQVAVLKAFGYGRGTIALHYALLALIPILAGTLLGTAVGLWFADLLAGLYSRYFQFPDARFVRDWGVVGAAFLVSAGAALAGALAAVHRAAGLPPAEAMRPEAPATFRPGPVERLGLQRFLGAADRMIVRNLERRPAKAALSAVGVGLAAAIVIVGWWMFDAVDMIKRIQFEEVDRYDVMVVFQSPASARVRWELERLEGVRLVEPYRAVPVRLVHGPRRERAALLGVIPGSELQRPVDRKLMRREVPPGGLLLNDVLAGDLEARGGDTITIEVLEGKRPVRQVVLASVTDDVLGVSARMSLPALHDLLGEGGTLSGAFLRVDPARSESLYPTLKARPAVSGVVVREAVIRGFEETIAESFMISITTMVFFACIIAVGIVYNGARVALSERGRELASLRVLGFTRREVTRLLLGEQGLLILAGLPLGALIGYGLAWLVATRFASALIRIPLMMPGRTFLAGFAVVIAAGVVSALAIRRRIHRLDLVAVLKTRE